MKAHQRLIREEILAREGAPDGVDLNLGRSRIERVSFQYAKQIILKYEWLGRMSATRHHYALMDGTGWHPLGVVCIGGENCTGGDRTSQMLGVKFAELAVLARGACTHFAPMHANSKLVSGALRLLRQDAPEKKVIIAYSDPRAGEIGTIYQACNWVCIGMTRGASFRMVNEASGHSFDSAKIIVTAQKLNVRWKVAYEMYLAQGYAKVPQPPKWRYVTILDRRDALLRARVERMSVPYPKRDLEVAVETSFNPFAVGE